MSQIRTIARRITPIRHALHGARALHDSLIERAWNVDTLSLPAADVNRDDEHDDGLCYEPMRYSILQPFLRPLQLTARDVVFDVGAGLGRALHACARLGVQRCVGVEIVPSFVSRARKNAEALRGRRCPIDIQLADASAADYRGGTVYMFFNPFGVDTMRAVLDRIHDTLHDDPRPVQIAYFTPRYESALTECPWLELTERKQSPFHRIAASYWRSTEKAAA